MSGYNYQNKCVFSFRRNTINDVSAVMSSGRLFHSFLTAEVNDRSPTVTLDAADGQKVGWKLTSDVHSETACQQRDSTDTTVTDRRLTLDED